MDPLSALSLAGNVVQFVQFAFRLLNSTQKIYSSASGRSSNGQHLEEVYSRLSDFSITLKGWVEHREAVGGHRAPVKGLKETVTSCKDDCDKLLDIIEKLRVKSGTKRRWWHSFSKAMHEVWHSDDIESLRARIADSRQLMVLKLCAISR